MKKYIVLAAAMFLLFSSIAIGGIPEYMTVQGRLTDAEDTPLSGSYRLRFRIYDAEVGGNLEWSEDHDNPNRVDVENGIFNVILGELNPLSINFDEEYWLEISIWNDTNGIWEIMDPRIRITSSGFSFSAKRLYDGSYYVIPSGTSSFDQINANTICLDTCESVWPVSGVSDMWVNETGDTMSGNLSMDTSWVKLDNTGTYGINWGPTDTSRIYDDFDLNIWTDDNLWIWGDNIYTERSIYPGQYVFGGFQTSDHISWGGNDFGILANRNLTGAGYVKGLTGLCIGNPPDCRIAWPSGGGDSDWFISGSNMYSGVSGNVGIGTTSPDAKLTIVDGAILASGNIGGTPVSGAGVRLMWIPAKGGAFRAGYVSGSRWDDANIGDYSVAMGVNSEASGYTSTALGYNSLASGYESAAIGGWSAAASGDYSLAFGYGPIASGDYSLAFGRWVTAGPNDHTYVFGRGVEFDARLVNNIPNSLMIGFNSDIPTLFVGPSSGVGTTGDVGIGTTNPTRKLDINGDVRIRTLDCTVYNNNGKLTTDSSGNIQCANDVGGGGGSVADVWVNETGDTMTGDLGMGGNQVQFSLSATGGLNWGSSEGRVYDDGNLNINTDDNLWVSAPGFVYVNTPDLGTAHDFSIGEDNSGDDDYLYFDEKTEYFVWDESSGEFDLSDDLNMNGNQICLDYCRSSWPSGDGLSCPDCHTLYVNRTGDSMTGNLDMNWNNINNVNLLNGGTPWTSANDGSGSGLNADLLDGLSSSAFQRDIGPDCGAGDYVYGVASDGTLRCRPDQGGTGGDSDWFISGDKLYNNTAGVEVGIGTSNPGRPLEIEATQDANIRLQDTSGSPAAYIEFFNPSSRSGWVGLPGSDYLSIGTEGTRDIVLMSGGDVGVGTDTPDSLLDVESSGTPILTVQTSATSGQDAIIRVRGARTTSSTSDIARVEFYNDESGGAFQMAEISARNADGTSGTSNSDLLFKVNDGTSLTEAMRIDDSGDVGIGTASPGYPLDVAGDIRTTTRLRIGTDTELYRSLPDLIQTPDSLAIGVNLGVGGDATVNGNLVAAGNIDFDGELMPDGATCSNGQILKKTGANNWDCAADDSGGGGYWTQSGSDLYPQNTGWNVGIATSSPLSSLQVGGGFQKLNYIPSSGITLNYPFAGVGFNAARRGDGNWQFDHDGANNGGSVIWSDAVGDMVFATIESTGGSTRTLTDSDIANRRRMIITGDGDVGIGTLNPGQQLSLGGTNDQGQLYMDSGDDFHIRNNQQDNEIVIYDGGGGLGFFYGGTERMEITSTGGVEIKNGNLDMNGNTIQRVTGIDTDTTMNIWMGGGTLSMENGDITNTNDLTVNGVLHLTNNMDQIRFTGNTDNWWLMSKGSPADNKAFAVYSPSGDGGSYSGWNFYVEEDGDAFVTGNLNVDGSISGGGLEFVDHIDVLRRSMAQGWTTGVTSWGGSGESVYINPGQYGPNVQWRGYTQARSGQCCPAVGGCWDAGSTIHIRFRNRDTGDLTSETSFSGRQRVDWNMGDPVNNAGDWQMQVYTDYSTGDCGCVGCWWGESTIWEGTIMAVVTT